MDINRIIKQLSRLSEDRKNRGLWIYDQNNDTHTEVTGILVQADDEVQLLVGYSSYPPNK